MASIRSSRDTAAERFDEQPRGQPCSARRSRGVALQAPRRARREHRAPAIPDAAVETFGQESAAPAAPQAQEEVPQRAPLRGRGRGRHRSMIHRRRMRKAFPIPRPTPQPRGRGVNANCAFFYRRFLLWASKIAEPIKLVAITREKRKKLHSSFCPRQRHRHFPLSI